MTVHDLQTIAVEAGRPLVGASVEAREVAVYVRGLAARLDTTAGRIVGDYARRAAYDLEELVGVLDDVAAGDSRG